MSESESYLKCSCQNCGGHLEFPQSGAGSTIACPHCGNPTALIAPKPARRNLGGFWIVAIAALGVISFASIKMKLPHKLPPPSSPQQTEIVQPARPAPQPPPAPAPPPDPWHGLKAGSVTLQKAENGSLVYAVGVLTNESDHERYGVKVEVAVFDDQDKQIGVATDYVPSIIAGKEWRFKALILDANAKRGEVTNVIEQN